MRDEYVIESKLGIHVRPAKKIVETAKRYPCKVYFEKDGKQLNAKSLINILALSAKYKDTVVLVTEGEQENDAQQAVGEILNSLAEEFHEGGN